MPGLAAEVMLCYTGLAGQFAFMAVTRASPFAVFIPLSCTLL